MIAARVQRQCYNLFQEVYPDTWKDVLQKFQEVNDCIDTSKTIAQQQQLFNKNVKKYTTPSDEVLTRLQFLSLSKGHGIEGAFLLGGKVIDQDHGLAAVYTTPGAEGVSTSSLQSSTILTNLNCSFSVNTAELIPMKSLPISGHMYSEYLIDS